MTRDITQNITKQAKSRPIIFSDPMVKAILDGHKTMTRRVSKLQQGARCGRVGDELWVREAFRVVDLMNDGDWSALIEYEDGTRRVILEGIHGDTRVGKHSPIHMPRAASRITLTVESIKLERLVDITEADARREGVADRKTFFRLWEQIHGMRGEAATNPYVWVVGFKVKEVRA